MSVACPNCKSRIVDFAPDSAARQGHGIFTAVQPLVCRDCRTRFSARTLTLDDYRYACCPRCFRQDLNTWRGVHWVPGWWMRLRIRLGARRYRCEYCRLNFASMRPRKEVFTFRRW